MPAGADEGKVTADTTNHSEHSGKYMLRLAAFAVALLTLAQVEILLLLAFSGWRKSKQGHGGHNEPQRTQRQIHA